MRAIPTPIALGAAWLVAGPFQVIAQTPDAPPFVEVSATAEVRVPSDRARINFAVVTEGETAALAGTRNAELMEAVIARLRATGARGLQIETSGYNLSPRYGRVGQDDRTPRITGYQATNNVMARVDDVEAVGALIDAAIGAGANQVTSLSFEASDTQAAREQALREAVAKARGEAQTMASALGVALGAPVEVRGGAQPPMPRPIPYMRAAMDMVQVAPATPIEASEQTVVAQVTIKYRLLVEGR